MKVAFLYAGQGSQKVGMGQDFYETYETYRAFIDSLEECKLSFDIKKLMHEGPLEELSQTEYTQGCMSAFAAGVTQLLANQGITPDVACGLSLGEYGALHAAGVFGAKEYVALTAFRGNAMMQAAKGQSCAMSAVLGMESDAVNEVCEQYKKDHTGYITVANYNCPGQYVICGEEEAVTDVEAMLKEHGAKRCVRLNVSGPFHTKFMAPAGEALKDYFSKMDFAKPSIPVLMNLTGDFYQEGEDLKELLVGQVQNSVRFENQLVAMMDAGVDTFVEIGPGNTLSGFLKKTAKAVGKDVTIMGIDSVSDFEAVCEKLAN